MAGDQTRCRERTAAAGADGGRLSGQAAEITVLEVADADAAARMHAECLSEAWSAGSFCELLEQSEVVAWKIAREGELKALLVSRRAADEIEILTLAVANGYRRRGFAKRLLSHLTEEAVARGVSHIFLEVRASNRAALGLYESAGYLEIARRQAYYLGDCAREDAIVMRLLIP